MSLTIISPLRRGALLAAPVLAACSFSGLSSPARAAIVADPAPPAAASESGATAPVPALAYSPDGTLLLSLDERGELLQRDARTGAIRYRGATGAVGACELHVLADGSLLVGQDFGSATLYEKPVEGKALAPRHFFNQEEVGRQVLANPPTFYALKLAQLAISPGEKLLAMVTVETAAKAGATSREPGAKTARIRVWSLAEGSLVREVTSLSADAGTPRLAWSDAQTLAVALPGVALQRFDATSGALKSEWKPPAEAASKPDPARTAAESERRMRQLPPALQERMRNRPPRAAANQAATFGALQGLSGDGNLLLAATPNGLQLWDTRDNSNHILERSERLGAGDDAVFSRDGSLVAMRAAGGFWLWKSDGSQVGWARIPFLKYLGAAFAPDGRSIALGDEAGVSRIWDTSTPLSKTAQTILPGHFEPWTRLSSTPNGLLASTARGVAALDASGGALKIARWFENTPLQSPAELPNYARTQTRQDVIGLAASPDGKMWAESVSFSSYTSTMSNMGIPRGELRVRDAGSGQVLWRLADSNNYSTVDLLRFLPDGTLLTGKRGGGGVSRTPQDNALGGLQARDGKTGQEKPFEILWGDKVGQREPGGIEILEASADGKTMVLSSGSGGEGVQWIDMASKQVRGSFGAHSTIASGPWALSPDGKWLAGPGSTSVQLWDVSGASKTGAPDVVLSLEPASRVQALKFSASGALAAGLADGRVLLWAPAFNKGGAPVWQTAAGRAISSLEFSRDGKTLWSGDERGELKARDAGSGALQSTLRLEAPAAEGSAAQWVKWDRSGKVERSTP